MCGFGSNCKFSHMSEEEQYKIRRQLEGTLLSEDGAVYHVIVYTCFSMWSTVVWVLFFLLWYCQYQTHNLSQVLWFTLRNLFQFFFVRGKMAGRGLWGPNCVWAKCRRMALEKGEEASCPQQQRVLTFLFCFKLVPTWLACLVSVLVHLESNCSFISAEISLLKKTQKRLRQNKRYLSNSSPPLTSHPRFYLLLQVDGESTLAVNGVERRFFLLNPLKWIICLALKVEEQL